MAETRSKARKVTRGSSRYKAQRPGSAKRSRSSDRGLISKQHWELKNVYKNFPQHTRQQVMAALTECKSESGDSEDRVRIMDCLRAKLSMRNAK